MYNKIMEQNIKKEKTLQEASEIELKATAFDLHQNINVSQRKYDLIIEELQRRVRVNIPQENN